MVLNPTSVLAASALIAALFCWEWVAARRLGLGRAGAAFAAVGCAGSGIALLVAHAGAGPAAAVLARLGPPGFDLVAVGTVLVAAGAIAWARARSRALVSTTAGHAGERAGDHAEHRVDDRADAAVAGHHVTHHVDDRAGEISRAIGFALVVAAVALVLTRRGLPEQAYEVALPEADGLRIPWLAAPIAALALSSLAASTGRLRARGAIACASCVLALIAIGAPGFHGLAAAAAESAGWIALIAAFAASSGLALLAADALESAPRGARQAGGLAFALLIALAASQPLASGAPLGGDPDDELVAFDTRPAQRVERTTAVEGRVSADLGADELRLVIQPTFEGGGAARVLAPELGPARDGWKSFASGPVDLGPLPPGSWRFDVEVLRRGEDGVLSTIGRRTASLARVGRVSPRWVGVFAIAAALFTLFVLTGTRWRWLAAVLAAACSAAAIRS